MFFFFAIQASLVFLFLGLIFPSLSLLLFLFHGLQTLKASLSKLCLQWHPLMGNTLVRYEYYIYENGNNGTCRGMSVPKPSWETQLPHFHNSILIDFWKKNIHAGVQGCVILYMKELTPLFSLLGL